MNDPRIANTGLITFTSFSYHVLPGTLLACISSYFVVKRLCKQQLQQEPNMTQKKELAIWKKTSSKLKEGTKEEKAVKERLMEYIKLLESEISEGKNRVIDISELEGKYIITDPSLFVNSCIILGAVIILFFMHSLVGLHLSLAWISIIGAIAHLLVSGIRDIEDVLEKVEFGTLMFFAALFVLMKSLEDLGLIDFIGQKTGELIAIVPEGNGRLAVAVTLILWVSAFVSAFIDNIPFTAAMIPVLTKLNIQVNLPLTPLVWALVYGTCLGGNGTIIGASANMVVAGISESQGYPMSFNQFFKVGFPVMVSSIAVCNVYMLIFHVLISWY